MKELLLVFLMLGQVGQRWTSGTTEPDNIPWAQIEQWKIFDELSDREIIDRLNKAGADPSGEGWDRFFSPKYHGFSNSAVARLRSMPARKSGTGKGTYSGDRTKGYWETCRDWTTRVQAYWRQYHSGAPLPTMPCLPEETPEPIEREKPPVVTPHRPPPVTTTVGLQLAPKKQEGPIIDQGARTTYNASDGQVAYQGQKNPGFHRADGSATLSSGEVIVDINTSVGAGKNDLSFQSVDSYFGKAWSTDTSNTNTYTVYPLSGTQVLIKSSSGADAATVNFRLEGD